MPEKKAENPSLDMDLEHSRLIQQWFDELWEDANEAEIAPELVARVFIQSSIRELVLKNGSQETGRIVSELKQMDEHGAFLAEITLQ